jgi:hypothetical protein
MEMTMKKLMMIISMALVLGLTGCNFLPDLEPTTVEVDTSNYLEISTLEQLKEMEVNRSYQLIADIDLSGEEWTPIGDIDQPFLGNFNGNGHTISNMTITENHMGFYGLFGYLKGDVENLKITDFLIQVEDDFVINAGALAGMALGTITNVHVDGNIQVASDGFNVYAGLLVGNQHTLPQNAVVSNEFTPNQISLNSAKGSLAVDQAAFAYVGGLLGKSHNSQVYLNEVYDTTISVDNFHTGFIGGLIGQNFIYDFEDTYEIALTSISYSLVYENIVDLALEFNQGQILTLGGLIGYQQNTSIQDNFIKISIDLTTITDYHIGLVIGENWGDDIKDNLSILDALNQNDESNGEIYQIFAEGFTIEAASGYYVDENDLTFTDDFASKESLTDVQGVDFYRLNYDDLDEDFILRIKEVFFDTSS